MNTKTLMALALTALMACSCTGEYGVAKKFLRKHSWGLPSATEQIYLYVPGSIYRTCSSLPAGVGEADSAAMHHSRLLSALNDSIFIDQFTRSLVATLSHARIPIVKITSEAQLPAPSRDCLILDVSALEAEEFVVPARSSFTIRTGLVYAYDHDARHFSANAWFQLNYDTVYYFLNQEVQEETGFRGTVTSLQSGKAHMNVEYTPLTINDAYATARALGETAAQLYMEKVLMEQVRAKKGRNRWYLFYNSDQNDINVMVPYEAGIQSSFEVVE